MVPRKLPREVRSGWTDLVVTPDRRVRSVDGLLTGWHEPEASHLAMLEAVAGRELLERSYTVALEEGTCGTSSGTFI
jgi:S-adenosylmethionine:tRNA ribosyltransferase-isomerase